MKVKKNDLIVVDNQLSQPLYKQIVHSVHRAISEGRLRKGDLLPSVNQLAQAYSIARGSVFKAYHELRTSGLIDSIPGKGYFVTSTNVQTPRRIFLLLSTFNPYREVLYNAFIERLRNKASVDIYFHHHNIGVFETLIRNHAAHYNTFVIMPELQRQTARILKELDHRKLYILDTGLKEFGDQYPCVCQHYEKDIHTMLAGHTARIRKYKRMILLFPENIRAYGVMNGFRDFFREFDFPAEVVENTGSFRPRRLDVCITMDDKDLVRIIHIAKNKGWKLGVDIGVISYHETPLKSVIADGITTITTDFEHMGTAMAEMILNNTRDRIENPFRMIDRNSF